MPDGIVVERIVRPWDDHYRSPPECLRALLAVEDLRDGLHECCAGDGILAAASADELGDDAVIATTLHPAARTYFNVQPGVDALTLTAPARRHIVTNPPYSLLGGRRLPKAGAATQIIGHLVRLMEDQGDAAGLVCCLLDIRFRLSADRNQRGGLLYEYPPATIHAFQDRVTMYPPLADGRKRNQGTSSYAWFVWRAPFARPGGATELRADLYSRAFRRADDRERFDLPVIGTPSKKRADE